MNTMFKYYSVDGENSNRIENRLKGELYLSSPLQFNDPYDCQMPEIINNTAECPKDNVLKILLENGFDESSYNSLIDNDKNIIQEVYTSQAGHLGILCLTTHNNNMLMWSHYSKHNGLCLEYDLDKLLLGLHNHISSLILGAGRYCPTYNPDKRIYADYVSYEPFLPTTSQLFFRAIADCRPKYWYKLNDWKYEDEFRIGVSLGGRLVVTIPDIVKHIYLGCNATMQQIRDIVHILQKNNLNIPISIMRKGTDNLYADEISV